MSQPVIIKNKIVYGYTDKATICRDMGREDYNDLTEAQQLNGDVCFIQGVDASALAPTNNIWNKLGTTPLAAGLPADCSQAINQIKSNLTDLIKFKNLTHSYTVAGNGFVNWNPTSDTGFNMLGYTPVGIVIFATNNTSVTVLNVQPTDNAWGIALRNVSATSQSNTFSYTVMYIKDIS